MEDKVELVVAMEALREIPEKWYVLGIKLKIDEKKLQAVKKQYDNPRDCLSQMVYLWFEFSEETRMCDLVAALYSINKPKLASQGKYSYI